MNTSPVKPRALGVVGSVLGLAALIVAVVHFYFGPIAEPEPVESFIAKKTVSIKSTIAARLKGEEITVPRREQSFDADQLVKEGAMITALVALSLGVLGFLRKEEYLPNGLAVSLGGATVVFSVSVVFAGIIVGALIIAAIVLALGQDAGA